MIEPVLADDVLLENIRQSMDERDSFHLWWLGQSGFLLQWQGQHLLFDPYLSDSLTIKYANTDKPHIRMTRLVVNPNRLALIDIATSSHNHTDHLDAETLVPLMRVNPNMVVIVPEANRKFAADRLGVDPERLLGMNDGQTVDCAGFHIHAIPAAHEQVERDEQQRCKYLGYVAEFGPWAVYHSGDTMLYDEMVERLRRWSIDVALLPINGRAPERRVAGNMNGVEAARLAKEISARLVIPCHFELFEFNTVTPEAFVNEAQHLGQAFRILKCGERWSSSELEVESA